MTVDREEYIALLAEKNLIAKRLRVVAEAARAALPQLCDTSSKGQAERAILEKAIRYAGLDPYASEEQRRNGQ